ncbi:pyridoxamine 5'-phosphate oxidase family protein [Arenibacter sp. M-2]|uniref:pyridoxamine 5'-phosphate oxidase family protein n=1 Tax=unclassified Arenibacter TaxID=2615047 RepID=UPI000D77568E|nr:MULTISPECIES: pyridoxamine 5'-phosphate oxidase family protein [unclassified Arenibacter]MDL5512189.1 pyridoxamine 5'-phosphate oxidase family protein [Arenibacter sp. M-2]PXX26523.1 pyridoxamine 5'-phosphate oxidase [Arenibacter sp. ARW7G5Y1]|tara:strand:+ start:6700 stop:7245 length:546 start_codon:yes stop_codon:yes gene_type:complete
MGKKLDSITTELKEFIQQQKIFFVGTAASEGRVNISPKGTDSFRILDQNKIVWLNLTGSGNETAAHLLKNNRMTVMFCAFEGKPMILRLYGQAKIYHRRDVEFHRYIKLFPENIGSRQIIEMDIDLVQTSCGFAVPFMDYKEERTALNSWSTKQGPAGIERYWENKNTRSIDGFETEILGD